MRNPDRSGSVGPPRSLHLKECSRTSSVGLQEVFGSGRLRKARLTDTSEVLALVSHIANGHHHARNP
jgi:hypothetical protein